MSTLKTFLNDMAPASVVLSCALGLVVTVAAVFGRGCA